MMGLIYVYVFRCIYTPCREEYQRIEERDANTNKPTPRRNITTQLVKSIDFVFFFLSI